MTIDSAGDHVVTEQLGVFVQANAVSITTSILAAWR
jgi:hypothetical protein